MAVCPSCGQENPEGFRLCGMCGTPLAAAGSRRDVRKLVTVVFADLTGSTALGETLDPESLRRVVGGYFDAMRAVLERHGGSVEKFIGDAVMAVFGIPVLHEDDALRAVRAAAEMQPALVALNEELERQHGIRLEMRIGVNTGEVMAGEGAPGQSFATGDAVNVAARLEQAAAPGEILVGETTLALVRDAVKVEPAGLVDAKGKREPLKAHRLLRVLPAAEGHARRLDSPLVGRDHERTLLRHAFERAGRERSSHLFTLLGAAGVGKSRLVAEFLRDVETEAAIARGRCLSYGEGITYWPAIEVVRSLAGIEGGDSPEVARGRIRELLGPGDDAGTNTERLVELLGLAAPTALADETAAAFRHLLEAAARERPLVVVIDDVQWGESTFLDLVEHVADWSRGVPVVLVCIGRPDLLDLRPAWGGGKLNATTVLLEALAEAECGRLIAHLLDEAPVGEDLVAHVARAAGGNPLFVEEMLGLLVEEGVVSRHEDGWQSGDLSAVPVPPTIRALLAARVDRLATEERLVLERAAVEGEVFHRGAVAVLAEEEPAVVTPRLLALVRRELIRPDRATFAGDEAFRFRHVLMRDAAYESLPKEVRARLHERFASWLEQQVAGRGEYDEIVGYHLEQACRYLAELGRSGETARLGGRAAPLLTAAGLRAYARADVPTATGLFRRAAALLPHDSPERALVRFELGNCLAEPGRYAEALAVLDDAIALAEASGDDVVRWRAVASRAWVVAQIETTDQAHDRCEQDARRAIAGLTPHGDDRGLTLAWRMVSDAHNLRGEGALWVEALERTLVHARRTRSRQDEFVATANLGGALFFGPTPRSVAVRRLEELRAEVVGDDLLEAAILRPLGGLLALDGRFEEGRRHIGAARDVLADLGLTWQLARISFMSGRLELLAGDLDAAEREYRRGYDLLRAMNESARASSLAGELAAVLHEQGRLDEAEEMGLTALELAAPSDVQPQATSRWVRAMVLARRGRLDEAEQLAREAVAIIGRSDFLSDSADALVALGTVLGLAGRAEEGDASLREALERYERKEHAVAAGRVRSLLGRAA